MLDDPVGTRHANMTRGKVKDVVCFLTPEQKLDPAKHHTRPSYVHTFPTKSVVSSLCKAMNFERSVATEISSVHSCMGCSTYPVPCLSHTEHQRVHRSPVNGHFN